MPRPKGLSQYPRQCDCCNSFWKNKSVYSYHINKSIKAKENKLLTFLNYEEEEEEEEEEMNVSNNKSKITPSINTFVQPTIPPIKKVKIDSAEEAWLNQNYENFVNSVELANLERSMLINAVIIASKNLEQNFKTGVVKVCEDRMTGLYF